MICRASALLSVQRGDSTDSVSNIRGDAAGVAGAADACCQTACTHCSHLIEQPGPADGSSCASLLSLNRSMRFLTDDSAAQCGRARRRCRASTPCWRRSTRTAASAPSCAPCGGSSRRSPDRFGGMRPRIDAPAVRRDHRQRAGEGSRTSSTLVAELKCQSATKVVGMRFQHTRLSMRACSLSTKWL